MRLNGWQRLWVVAVALWALVCVVALVIISGDDFFGPFLWMRVRWTIIAWLIPSVLLYALGWTIGWALREIKSQ